MGKLGVIAGVAVGYVLGARAGRDRYEQIEAKVRGVWRDPRVQKAKDQAGDLAQEKGAQVQDKVSQATSDDEFGSDPGHTDMPTPNDLPAAPAGGYGA